MEKVMEIQPSINDSGIIHTCFLQNITCKRYFKLTSSIPESNSSIYNLFDDNTSTYYNTYARYNFIEVEIKGALLVKAIMMHGIYTPYPNGFDLLGSNDREAWDLILRKEDLNQELYINKKLYNISNDKMY